MATSYRVDYDTAAIRAAARKLKQYAQTLSNGAQPNIRRVQQTLPNNLMGEAANALSARVSEMGADVNVLINSLQGLSSALFKYADDIDCMTKQLRGSMS